MAHVIETESPVIPVASNHRETESEDICTCYNLAMELINKENSKVIMKLQTVKLDIK